MQLKDLGSDIAAEVETILSTQFNITVANTSSVPHSDDGAITFPNLDSMQQSCKVVETCVLYIDIRRSTELNLSHKPRTVAKLYSSFVRAMVRCAEQYGGHVRGIIGDRVMVLFDRDNCYVNAVHTAIAMNTVSTYIINKHFEKGHVQCGIGIDFGKMLATKTGFRRHGSQRHNYRSLVWLGRPANVASKLTDVANKEAVSKAITMARVAYDYGSGWQWTDEPLDSFVANFDDTYPTGLKHKSSYYQAFFISPSTIIERPKTPAILMTKAVYDGYRAAKPDAQSIKMGWYRKYEISVPGYGEAVYGCDLVFSEMKPTSNVR